MCKYMYKMYKIYNLIHKNLTKMYKCCLWDSNFGSILVEISAGWAPNVYSANLNSRDSEASLN